MTAPAFYRLWPAMLTWTVHAEEDGSWTLPLSHPIRAIGLQDSGLRTQWATQEVADGAFDWRDTDRLALTCMRRGLTMLGTVRGIPAVHTQSLLPDGYNQVGGMAAPGMAELCRYVTELVWRYNRKSAANWSGQRLMPRLKLFNEPMWDFEPTLENAGTPDWSRLAALCGAAYQVAHEADPRIVCTSPAWPAGHIETLPAFLRAVAELGHACFDAIAINAYGMDWPKLYQLLSAARRILGEAGYPPDFPIDLTECGHQAKYRPAFLELPEDQQGREWANCHLLACTFGVTGMQTYSWNPNKRVQELGEVYSMREHHGWANYVQLLAPHIGRTVQLLDRDGNGRCTWRISGRRVVI